MLRALGLGLVFVLAGCQGGSSGESPPVTGCCRPTVAGGPCASYGDYLSAKAAFTRRSEDELVTATLEDASWLRLEGSPEEVRKNHRGYFEQGYTTFEVLLRDRRFTRPTEESFVLEDGLGRRANSKPVAYHSSMTLVDDHYEYRFQLSFQHVLTKDVPWIRLTRNFTGSSVEWKFTEENAPTTAGR